MKKTFTFLMAALMLLTMMVLPGKAVGQNSYEITCNMSDQGWSNSTAISSGTLKTKVNSTVTNTVFTYTSGTGDSGTTEGPKYFTSGSNVRFYVSKASSGSTANGNWMQISIPSNTTVTAIEITGVSSYSPDIEYNIDGGSDVSCSASNNKYTVSSISATTSFKFRNVNTSTSTNTQLRITAIKITYTTSGGGSTVATPTFSPSAGAVASGTQVTITCATEGASIYYTMGNDPADPTTSSTVYSSSSKPTITTATTIKAIGVLTGYNNSAVAEATYTITTTGPTVTIGTLTHVTSLVMWSLDPDVDISNGDEVAAGTEVFVQPTAESGYTVEGITVVDANSTPVDVTENSGNWSFYMPNSSVTINATATQNSPIIGGSKYVKVTTDNIPDGQYLIVYEDGSLAFNGSLETLDAAGNTISVSISNNIITATTATAAAEFTINTNNDVSTIQSASGYYIGNDSNSNALSSSTTTQYTNTISIDESGNAVVVSSGGAYLRYNSASNQTRFRYFKSATYTNQEAIQLYKKVDYTITISPYSNTTSKDGWYLIASPVSTIPTEVTNMIHSDLTTHGYDLYRFNQSNASNTQWENYKNHTTGFNITPGQGYLYANSQSVILGFSGTAYSEKGTFNLIFDENVENKAQGWNLMGNPYATDATIEHAYYRMNNTHNGLISATADENVNAFEGIFVQATATGQTVTFSPVRGKEEKTINNALVINLNRNDKVIDRAIVRFGESEKLSKFQLFEGSTKIYIPQNGADYAIAAMDDNTQAFNLNFHAKTTGKYTLSLGETSNLSYVHIFDRMTGEDVDMLLEDSYSFIGSPADSEERFIVRLSYNASPTDSETFAYQSGNGIIVNGEGELQIFDVTGSKVMTTTINGVQTVNGLDNGLYIFKLNEKAQKIVVR